METQTKTQEGKAELLEKLGFKTLASELTRLKARKRKLALAYELYRFVRQEQVDKFNAELKKKTGENLGDAWSQSYQMLAFTPIESYDKVPPDSVLTSLGTAIEHKCFDNFEVAYIKNVKDPLLFGRVEGCSDRFFIDQWGDDVKITDLLKDNEG